ncbi:MAG TPA: hypothetical protein PKE63_02920 [Lacibacter sp.]|nr:hypothetical protein [Lacibacter sp.]HMO88525.1 hypothetical protein [Lacibacter sp.]HMP86198.1 hypothetical protein [Lacibacter sp.]
MKKINFTSEYINSLPSNREDAIAHGEKYFYDGKLCKNGHDSVKIAKENGCFYCKRDKTRITAEKRRKRNGIIPKNKVLPLQKGDNYCQLIATGGFKVEYSKNRKKNRNINYHEVVCSCGETFWLVAYNWGISEQCPNCWLKTMAQNNVLHNESQTIIGQLYYSAKRRAKTSGIKFEIEIEDIKIPKYCPIFNVELDTRLGESSNRKPRFNAPSLDRINSDLGYVKDNIIIMSYKANVLKKDGTSEEHLKIAAFMEKMGITSI